MRITLPGYRLYEYQLVLLPNEALRQKILHVKQEFAAAYRLPFTPGGKPYLPLVSFQQYEMMEERLLQKINLVAMGQQPFRLELKDFGSFPSHSIHIRVASRTPVLDLVKNLRTECHRLMKIKEESKPHFVTDPYVAIGSRLKPWQYEKGWLDFSQRSVSGKCIADAMILLKREQGSKAWQVARRFEFMNLPVLTRQGELFA